MHTTILRIRSAYGKLLRGFAVLAGFCTFAIMWVIDFNALGRKIFNTPMPAALEITQTLLVVSIMMPFALALLHRQHVNTVFLTTHFSSSVRRFLYIIWMLAGFALFAAITYGTFRYGLRSYYMNEQTWGAGLKFAIWPSKLAVSFGALLICIQFLLEAICSILIADYHDEIINSTPEHAHV